MGETGTGGAGEAGALAKWFRRWGPGLAWTAGICAVLTVIDVLTPRQDVWWWIGTWAKTPGFAVTAALIAAALTYLAAKDRLAVEDRWKVAEVEAAREKAWWDDYKALDPDINKAKPGVVAWLQDTARGDGQNKAIQKYRTAAVTQAQVDVSDYRSRLVESARQSILDGTLGRITLNTSPNLIAWSDAGAMTSSPNVQVTLRHPKPSGSPQSTPEPRHPQPAKDQPARSEHDDDQPR